ncbi:hypothetical protein [Filobacillus milosensis]|uniref:hypothetical protein n=1 Tax=Filobacillus milosensis TaxID=94137 RepID=UPI00129B8121|nr:hypothetical protein [Filobacillus milosensis]
MGFLFLLIQLGIFLIVVSTYHNEKMLKKIHEQNEETGQFNDENEVVAKLNL